MSARGHQGLLLTAGSDGDPYWSKVVSLLHLNGPDNSTAIIDETGKAWSGSGSIRIFTAQSRWGGSSCYFNGSAWLQASNNAAFDFGAGDFTIEAWVYQAMISPGIVMIVTRQVDPAGMALQLRLNNGYPEVVVRDPATQQVLTISGTVKVSAGAWFHVRLVRNAGALMLALNGTISATGTSTAQLSASARGFVVGAGDGSNPGSTNRITAYMNDVRITAAARDPTEIVTAQFPNHG